MYLERADDEDQKKVESWKGDADGILVFVSTHLLSCFTSRSRITDWSLLSRGRDTASGLHSEPPAELSGCLSILPRERLSTTL